MSVYTVPNYAEVAPTRLRQAELHRADVEILGRAASKSGVVTGCVVTASGSDMVLSISGGVAVIRGLPVVVTAGTVTAVADGTNPRIAHVTVNTSGTLAISHGTAAAYNPPSNDPLGPDLPAITSAIVLAQIYIPDGATSLTTASNVVGRALRLTYGDAEEVGILDAGAVADAVYYKVNTTNASATITSDGAAAVWTSADVGKAIVIRAAGAAGADLTTTIATFTSSSQVTLAASAGATTTAREAAWGTDNTSVVNTTASVLSTLGGGTLRASPATQGYLCTGALTIPPNVTLLGPARTPTMNNETIRTVSGNTQNRSHACLWTTQGRGTGGSGTPGSGTAFITLERNAVVEGFEVFYPIQQKTATPDSYPPCIRFADSNGGALGHSNAAIRNMLLINPYYGVECMDHERAIIEFLFMDALKRGIFMSEIYDVPHVSGVEIWNFWEATSGNWASPNPVQSYRMANCVGFEVQRADQVEYSRCFCYGLFVGYLFDDHSGVGVGYGNFVSCSSDQVAYSIIYNDASAYGYKFIGGTHLSRSAGGRGVYIGGTQTGPGNLSLSGVTLQSADNDYLIEYAGNAQNDSANQTVIAFNGCPLSWKTNGVAVYLNSSATSNTGTTNRTQPTLKLNGCEFLTVTGYQLDSSALTSSSLFTVNLTNNLFQGGERWNENATKKVIGYSGNFSDGPQVGQRGDSRVILTAYSATAVANTTTETAFPPSATIQARSLRANQVIRLTYRGWFGTRATTQNNVVIRIKMGATTIATVTCAPPAGLTAIPFSWQLDATIEVVTTGATGTVNTHGNLVMFTSTANPPANQIYPIVQNGTTTVDTTADCSVTVTAAWAAANTANTITLAQAIAEAVN